VRNRSVYAALLAVQVFFGTLPIAIKIALRDLSAPSIALLRVTGAALLFFAMQRTLVGERVQSRRDYALLALYALFGVVANQLLYISALTLTTATDAQVMAAAGPAFTLLVAISLRREKASAAKWAGIALSAAGAIYLVGAGFGSGSGVGNVLALANTAFYCVYLVLSRDLLRRYDALTVVTWVFIFGAVGILPWGAWALSSRAVTPGATTWLALAWIIVFPTVGAYYLNVYALKRVEASIVSVFVYLQPIVTALIAAPVLGEHPSPRLLPAGALIFAGVLIAGFAGRKPSDGSHHPSPADQTFVET
jgi:drug/metabolite transporter (DMT)-like permease